MPTLTIRNLSEAVLLALRVRAAGSGRSVEGELREIVEAAVLPVERVRVGSALANIGRAVGGVSLHPARELLVGVPKGAPDNGKPVDRKPVDQKAGDGAPE